MFAVPLVVFFRYKLSFMVLIRTRLDLIRYINMRALFIVVSRLSYSLWNKHPILDGTFILYRATINFKSYFKINATAVRRAQSFALSLTAQTQRVVYPFHSPLGFNQYL
jgi:hypothetical protein